MFVVSGTPIGLSFFFLTIATRWQWSARRPFSRSTFLSGWSPTRGLRGRTARRSYRRSYRRTSYRPVGWSSSWAYRRPWGNGRTTWRKRTTRRRRPTPWRVWWPSPWRPPVWAGASGITSVVWSTVSSSEPSTWPVIVTIMWSSVVSSTVSRVVRRPSRVTIPVVIVARSWGRRRVSTCLVSTWHFGINTYHWISSFSPPFSCLSRPSARRRPCEWKMSVQDQDDYDALTIVTELERVENVCGPHYNNSLARQLSQCCKPLLMSHTNYQH